MGCEAFISPQLAVPVGAFPAHRLQKLFDQAAKEGALRVGGKSIGISINKQTGALVRPRSQKVMLRMPIDDLERARRLAAANGVGYQTYIKMIVRQGLDRARVPPDIHRRPVTEAAEARRELKPLSQR
jgi:hypothetical protein